MTPCGGRGGAAFDDFEPRVSGWTVISKPASGFITIDAGSGLVRRLGVPDLYDVSGELYKAGGDEHGILALESPSRPIELGDQVTLVVRTAIRP